MVGLYSLASAGRGLRRAEGCRHHVRGLAEEGPLQVSGATFLSFVPSKHIHVHHTSVKMYVQEKVPGAWLTYGWLLSGRFLH